MKISDLASKIGDAMLSPKTVETELNALKRDNPNFDKAVNYIDPEFNQVPIKNALALIESEFEGTVVGIYTIDELRALRDKFGVDFAIEYAGKTENLINDVLSTFSEPGFDDETGMQIGVESYPGRIDEFERLTLDRLGFLMDEIGLVPENSVYEILLENQVFFARPAIFNKVMEKGDKTEFVELAMQELTNEKITNSAIVKFLGSTVTRDQVKAHLNPQSNNETFLEELSRIYKPILDAEPIDKERRNPGICLKGDFVKRIGDVVEHTKVGIVACKEFQIDTTTFAPNAREWFPAMWMIWTEQVAELLFGRKSSTAAKVFATKEVQRDFDLVKGLQWPTGHDFKDVTGTTYASIIGRGSAPKVYRDPDEEKTDQILRDEPTSLILRSSEEYPNLFPQRDAYMQEKMSRHFVGRNFTAMVKRGNTYRAANIQDRQKKLGFTWTQVPSSFSPSGLASEWRPLVETHPNTVTVYFQTPQENKCLVWMFCDKALLHSNTSVRITWMHNGNYNHAGTLILGEDSVRVYEPNFLGLQSLAGNFRNPDCKDEMDNGWCQTASLFFMEEMILNNDALISDELLISFRKLMDDLPPDFASQRLSPQVVDPIITMQPEKTQEFIRLFAFDPENKLCALTNFLRALAKRYERLQTSLFREFVLGLVSTVGTGGPYCSRSTGVF